MAKNTNEATATQLPVGEGNRVLTRAGAPKDAEGNAIVTRYARLRALKDNETGTCLEVKPGAKIAGVYTESFVDQKFSKQNFVIKTSEGNVVITGGNLPSRMKEVPAGAYVEITYKGKSEMKSGKFKGTMAHNFQVDYERI